MEKLLQWSIAQQSGDKEAASKIGQPDPRTLAQLFGAQVDEATLMKQAIAVIENDEATSEAKETAFDNFEMIIENLDNANNIENLKLWGPIINQLDGDFSSLAASIIGTAVQNNPKCQEDFNKYPEGVKKLINHSKLTNETEIEKSQQESVNKSLFALASFIRNFQAGYDNFDSLQGWEIVNGLDPKFFNHTIKTKLRILSLISAILSTGLDDDKQLNVRKYNLIEGLLPVFDTDHIGCIDKALFIIHQLKEHRYDFSTEEKKFISDALTKISPLKDQLSHDDINAIKELLI